MNEGGIASFGARFVVETNFNQAVREMDLVDRQLDKMERTVRWLGTQGVAHINAFAAAVARAAAAQGMLLNASGGFLYGPHVSLQTGVLPSGTGVIVPSSLRQPLYLPSFVPVYRPPMPQPFAAHAPPTVSPYGVVDPLGGFRTLSSPNLISPVISGTGTVGRVPMAGAPVTGGPSAIGSPPGGTPINPNTPAMGGPTPEIIPHPTMFGRGAYVYTVPFTHVPGFRQRFRENFTAPAAVAMSSLGSSARFLSPYNLMRIASGIYIGQQVGNLARYATSQTIGQARFLEERLELLENALTSPQMGIDRSLAATLADRLTSSSYFAGMPVTAAEMGLSRAELAEQFRQLAPIIRITARTQDEFQTGLQTGALARALLVARDPVQGTQGATVALSELYSGGPDRFRSLSLRFELPRNRLREIEQEMGGPGVADPGQVVIQMLREMGFGPEYLERRAGTFSGQVERFGALFSNFRIDLWERSMNKVKENLTALNDTFEAFLNSSAGDRVIGALDTVFGAITGFLIRDPVNLMVGLMRGEGPITSDRLARGISEYMQAREGRWVDAAGRLTDAATAFREAADLITSKGIEQAVRTAGYGVSLTGGTMFGTIGGVVGLGMLDRVLAGGAMTRASRQLVTDGAAAARATAARGLATAGATLLPIAAIAGVAALGTLGYQSIRGAQDWQRFAAAYPELAAASNLDPDMGATSMFLDYLITQARRVARFGSRASRFASNLLSGQEYVDPYLGDPLVSALAEARETVEWGNVVGRLQQQAAMQSLGTTNENMVRSALAMTVHEIIANNPGSDLAKRFEAEGVGFIGQLVEQGMKGYGQTDVTGTVLSGVVLEAAAARNIAVTYGGNTLVADPASQLGQAGQAALWNQVLGVAGGDSKQALRILTEILEYTAQTAVNTSALNPESAFSFMRPSGQGDMFTGFINDPDMRLARRTGVRLPNIPAAVSASTAPRITSSLGAGPGGTQFVSRSPYAYQAFDPFFGGILTSGYGEVREGGRVHRGLDYVLPPDQGSVLTAFTAGRVEYLQSAEDYARYPMFQGGYGVYGNTAVLTDTLGVMHTFSHLSDETIPRFGSLTEVRAGQQFAIQGNTGQVRSSHDGDGTHVHQEMWIPDGRGGYTHVDPLHAEDYSTNILPNAQRELRGGAVGINIDFTGSVFNFATVDEFIEAVIPVIESELRDKAVEMYDSAVATKGRQGLMR